MKKCNVCHELLSKSEFNSDISRPDNLDNRCKKCQSEVNRFYRLKNDKYFRKYRKANNFKYKHTMREQYKIWYYKNKEKTKAHAVLNYLIEKGDIERGACEICGLLKNTHGHHDDYTKPLDVNWLCRDCHGLWHQLLNEWQRQKESGRWDIQGRSIRFGPSANALHRTE